MTILIDKNTKVIVQGVTGHQGKFHSKRMLEYGTKIVAGVTPGKGGQVVHDKIPVYETVKEAKDATDANASIIFVPARFATDSVFEAINAGLSLVVVITEHIPIHDALKFVNYAKANRTVIIGPNTPGIISPGESLLGIMPPHIFKRGSIGIVSRSGTLTYEIASALSRNGFGQSTCVGIGGDPVTGADFIEILQYFNDDKDTKAVVLIGEIGGDAEERAAEYIKEYFSKPVVAFIAGRTAPPGKRMGHAGAIISGKSGTAETKINALKQAGVEIANLPSEVPELLRELT
ncbi:MAG: succinate--CoA ligase subunit alpha [Candidatus Asgardarchaeia archaeon]